MNLTPLSKGELDPSILVYADSRNGELRLTYAYTSAGKVTALVNLTAAEPIESGVICYGIGYATHKAYRGRGLATALVSAALAELKNGLHRNGITAFHVEAIVSADNLASQRVAEKVISETGSPGTDNSGTPIIQYVRKIATDP